MVTEHSDIADPKLSYLLNNYAYDLDNQLNPDMFRSRAGFVMLTFPIDAVAYDRMLLAEPPEGTVEHRYWQNGMEKFGLPLSYISNIKRPAIIAAAAILTRCCARTLAEQEANNHGNG